MMLSAYRIQPNITNKRTKNVSNTNFDNNPHRGHDLKQPQMTSKVLTKHSTNPKSTVKRTPNARNKNFPQAGSVHESIEKNDDYLDEILHSNNL